MSATIINQGPDSNDCPPDRGATLRARRLALELSVAQLAGLADCGTASIERIEGGQRPRRSPTLTRIYLVLDRLEAAQSREGDS